MIRQSADGTSIHALQLRRYAAVVITACLLAGAAGASVAGETPRLYAEGGGQGGGEVPAPDEAALEALFDSQRGLMIKALSKIAPSSANVPEIFFVGFAGQASEDVFLNEALAAADLFRRRFGAKRRAMVLANNPKSAHELPFASVSNLGVALREIAGKMGEEDILFLYLTSHGQHKRLSVRYGRVDFPDLRPAHLRRILDEVGIKNRVLAISACYSGSFIEALKGGNTLVMTASASDRVSFGCGHDGTFTYFGKALIGDALENEISFTRAFEIAARSIEKQEKKEGLVPSKPQIHVGKSIGAVLQKIEQHLQGLR